VGTAELVYSQEKKQPTNYNLPPGYTLSESKKIIDLSYKLKGNQSSQTYKDAALKFFLKDLSREELSQEPVEYQKYVKKGEAYILSLSDVVKSIYSDAELWHIYAFDQELMEKLKTVQ